MTPAFCRSLYCCWTSVRLDAGLSRACSVAGGGAAMAASIERINTVLSARCDQAVAVSVGGAARTPLTTDPHTAAMASSDRQGIASVGIKQCRDAS